MNADLKPCPFCGNKFIIKITLVSENHVLVVCQKCKAQIRGFYTEGSKEYAEEQIIKDWNKRAIE